MRFLRSTPWTVDRPLLRGPILLSWPEWGVLLILAGAGLLVPKFSPWWAPQFFLLGFVAVQFCSFVLLQKWLYAYGTAFGCGLIALQWPNMVYSGLMLLVVYGFAAAGIRATLEAFHHDADRYERLMPGIRGRSKPDLERGPVSTCGWAFDALRPNHIPEFSVGRRHGLAISLLAGFWTFVLITRLLAFANWFPTELKGKPQQLANQMERYTSEFVVPCSIVLALIAAVLITIRLIVYAAASGRPSACWGVWQQARGSFQDTTGYSLARCLSLLWRSPAGS